MFCPQCGQPVPEGAAFCPACGTRVPGPAPAAAVDEIAVPSRPPLGVAGYAGFWRRLAAFLIDSVVLGVVTFPIGLIAPIAIFTESDFATLLGKLMALAATRGIIAWIYFAGFESSPWQATLGKRAIGIRVTDSSGARIHFGRASGRFFGKLLSGLVLCLGFLLAAFTSRKQALHDLLAGTLVVR